ncbi:fibrillarin-like rRNA/tRNA 2'-O-methyltransferase [Candidatus Woesearchaeota archaeon]|nr:fibrillarin-like rRNA/tRNA 2'-O-methyltransferase [Candidatus Woesearchaeota archaeon]
MPPKPHIIFELYQDGRRLYTKNAFPGTKASFDEIITREGKEEYREFDPTRSKLAAAVVKGAGNVGIRKGNLVLYLGASHGYTPSFVSDMIGREGMIFAVDPAPRVVRDLVFLAEQRKNIAPILADANHPEEYEKRILSVDVVYQDVAQRNQAEIFLRNCKLFLKSGGYGLLAVKARSIDAKKSSRQIFEETRRILEKEMQVVDFRILDPLEKDHCMIVVKKK